MICTVPLVFMFFVETETLQFSTQRIYVEKLGISCMFAVRFNLESVIGTVYGYNNLVNSPRICTVSM
jgi:hypothetical protein